MTGIKLGLALYSKWRACKRSDYMENSTEIPLCLPVRNGPECRGKKRGDNREAAKWGEVCCKITNTGIEEIIYCTNWKKKAVLKGTSWGWWPQSRLFFRSETGGKKNEAEWNTYKVRVWNNGGRVEWRAAMTAAPAALMRNRRGCDPTSISTVSSKDVRWQC